MLSKLFFHVFGVGNGHFFEQKSYPLFFVLSKLLYFLIDPSNWLIAGLICWLIFKKRAWRKKLGWVLIVVFFLFSNNYLYKALVMAWQAPVEAGLPNGSYQTAILLSGMTYSSEKNEVFFGGTSDRFIQTALLYHTGHIQQIVISGGDGSLEQERPKEALFLKEKLTELKVPAGNLIAEPLSKNTYENAVACKRIIDSLHLRSPVLLITSAMHMRRAKACFEKQKIDVVPFACNYSAVDNTLSFSSLLIPDLSVLLQWKPTLKEIVGLLTYKLTNKA